MIPWYPLYTPNSQGVFHCSNPQISGPMIPTVLEHRGKIWGENDTLEEKSGLIWFPVLVTSPLTGVLSKIPPKHPFRNTVESPVESLTAFSHHQGTSDIQDMSTSKNGVSNCSSNFAWNPQCKTHHQLEWWGWLTPFPSSFPPDVIVFNELFPPIFTGWWLFCLKKLRFYSQSNQWKYICSGQSLKKKHAFLRIKFDFSLCCHL